MCIYRLFKVVGCTVAGCEKQYQEPISFRQSTQINNEMAATYILKFLTANENFTKSHTASLSELISELEKLKDITPRQEYEEIEKRMVTLKKELNAVSKLSESLRTVREIMTNRPMPSSQEEIEKLRKTVVSAFSEKSTM